MEPNATQSSGQQFQYKPLQHKNEIRLLRVAKPCASVQKSWRFSLIHAIIESAPPYETVSYVWGRPVRNHNLVLNDGTILSVTENLARVIHESARHCSTGYLWVDQICIDQDNQEERNHQVGIMGAIYQAGYQVLVSLGPIDLHPCSALDFICSTANNALERGLPKETFLQQLQIILLGDAALTTGHLVMQKDDHRLAIWQLYKYLGSSWFARGWVFQEIILSKQSKIMIGSSTVSLEGFYWICEAIMQVEQGDILSVGLEDVTISAHGLAIISVMRRVWQSLHRPGDSESLTYPWFPELLSDIVSRMQTSLPQDRIYAFLGLSMDLNIRIEPNYGYSGDKVLACAAKSIIQGSQNLDIFEYLCRLGDGDNNRPFVRKPPTWVPDFTSKAHVTPFRRSMTLQAAHGCVMYPHRGRCNLELLVAHGKAIDRIQTRIDPRIPPYTEGMSFDFSYYVASAVRCWELSERRVPRPTAETVFAALVGQGHCDSEMAARSLGNEQLPNMLLSVVRYYFDRLEVKVGTDQSALSGYWE
ncbi:het-domain-containing protein [Fusarium mundagurra]|uniref:Het-domain-containing protein n=1 Tax=Fusarium mundagurra TaxID=1567541 RepID=A0A8H6D6T4_9HYPO|nr:het-domain-containing protein [Fusarium mundagurra]